MSYPIPPGDPDRSDQGWSSGDPSGTGQRPEQPYGTQPYGQQYPSPPYGAQPYGQPQNQQYGQPYPSPMYGSAPGQASTNTMAVLALVAGISGFTFLPLLGSIAAVIMAPMARREIARTGEQGATLATFGLVLGWVGLILAAIAAVIFALLIAGSFAFTVNTS